MKYPYVLRNGEFIRSEEANISVFNKAMFFNYAVYSNIKIVQGKMFIPDLEIIKLFESAKILKMKHKFEKEKVKKWVYALIKKNNIKDALVRLLLIGGNENEEPILFLFPIGLTFYPQKLFKRGVELVTYEGERFMPKAKAKNLLLNYVAFMKAKENNAIDALLIDNGGNITEGTRTSFFAIQGDTLIAPPDEDVLEGATRKIILEIAQKRMKIEKRKISLKEIGKLDSCFISGTTINIMPVRKIDQNHFDDFEKIYQLQRDFKDYCNTSSNYS